jgi:uncharacterized protein (TIGR03067 family)
MKKLRLIVPVLLLLLVVVRCNRGNEKLEGIWQLQKMNINGTELDATNMGNWHWEFNDEGGYMINMDGAIEKGTYKLKDKLITLKCTTNKEKPEIDYTITNLDSTQLVLSAKGAKNSSVLTFIKRAAGEMGEDD